MLNRNNRLSFFLMISSLLLLLVFLWVWLKQVYKDDLEVLTKELTFFYANTARDIEDESFHKLILGPIIEIKDSIILNVEGKRLEDVNLLFESAEKFSEAKQPDFRSLERDTNYRIEINSFDDSMFITGNRMKNVSVIMQIDDGEELRLDSILNANTPKDAPTVLEKLNKQLATKLDDKAIAASYEIIMYQDTGFLSEKLQEGYYRDILKGDVYKLAIAEFQSSVIKGMYTEILFSIFLFSLVSLAFFFIYRSLQQQQRLTALKNDFISNITHELKTPITTVGVAIEAMSSFNALNDPEKTKEYLQISKHELNRLSLLVDKVLKMSLFEQKEPKLKIEMFDLKELTQEIVTSMRLQFEKVAAKINLNIEGTDFQLNGDRLHLMSVIYNLLDNALKYSPHDPEIEINLREASEAVELEVRDNGLGISEEYQNKIFEKFFRVPTGNTHHIKGHGLGLSYVASVIRKHEGDISLKSRIGEGSRFIIQLPR